jgi:hypothetical protein
MMVVAVEDEDTVAAAEEDKDVAAAVEEDNDGCGMAGACGR